METLTFSVISNQPAIYYGAATISGAFSGLIAYAIQETLTLERTGREPWRWFFIIEGSMALFVGALVVIFLPRFPDQLRGRKHWLFRPEEIELAIQRMRCKSSQVLLPISHLQVQCY